MNEKISLNSKESLYNIELPPDLDLLIQNSVEKGYVNMQKKKNNRRTLILKRASIIIAVVGIGCVTAIPVKALVSSLVRERMEQIPVEELKEAESVLNEQEVAADSYSREYTETEKKRFNELREAYLNGSFPKKELVQAETLDAALTDTLYFAQDTSCFYLPQRNLTDEEILQIIDFHAARDYAIEQKNTAELDEKRKNAEAARKESGGISEENAISLGKEWLYNLYGISETNIVADSYPATDDARFNTMTYTVHFTLPDDTYYQFTFDMQGSLYSIVNGTNLELDMEMATTSMLHEKKEKLCQKANEILTGQLHKESDFEKIVYSYREHDNRLSNSNSISFYFIQANGSAYNVDMDVTSETFAGFQFITDYTEYTDALRKGEESLEGGNSVLMLKEPGTIVYKEMS